MTNRNTIILPLLPGALSIRFSLTNAIFFSYILLVFLLSGFLEMLSGGIYRQSHAIILVVILSFFYKPRFNMASILALFLSGQIVLSGVIGYSSGEDIVLFLRGPIFVLLTYHAINGWLRNHTQDVEKLWVILFGIGVLQLPIIILQTVFWQQMTAYIPGGVSNVDVGFGTFPVKADYSMTFFLGMLVFVLLFGGVKLANQKWRYFLLVWYTLTVLVANSQVMQLALILLWIVYILFHLRPQFILFSLVGIAVLSIAIFVLRQNEWMPLSLSATFSALQDQIQGNVNTGGFSRGATFYELFSTQIDWIGKGPGYYYSVLNRQVVGLDIQGHLLTYYAEIGMIGLLISYALLWSIAKPVYINKRSIYLNVSASTTFLVIVILSSTSYVLNQLPILSIYILALYWVQYSWKKHENT